MQVQRSAVRPKPRWRFGGRLKRIDVCLLPEKYLAPLLEKAFARVSGDEQLANLLYDFGFPVYWL